MRFDDNLVVVKSSNLKLAIIMKEAKENVLTGGVVKASRINEKQKKMNNDNKPVGQVAFK